MGIHNAALLGDILDDLLDYEKDRSKGVQNAYSYFVMLYGAQAPARLQEFIEEKIRAFETLRLSVAGGTPRVDEFLRTGNQLEIDPFYRNVLVPTEEEGRFKCNFTIPPPVLDNIG